MMGRILKQDPELYASMQFENPNVRSVLAELEKQLTNHKFTIAAKDQRRFVEEFKQSRTHFGENELNRAFELFENLSALMIDLDDDNAIELLIEKDRPGFLADIALLFAESRISLTSFHSVKCNEGYRFRIGLDRSKNESEVMDVTGILAGIKGIKILV